MGGEVRERVIDARRRKEEGAATAVGGAEGKKEGERRKGGRTLSSLDAESSAERFFWLVSYQGISPSAYGRHSDCE